MKDLQRQRYTETSLQMHRSPKLLETPPFAIPQEMAKEMVASEKVADIASLKQFAEFVSRSSNIWKQTSGAHPELAKEMREGFAEASFAEAVGKPNYMKRLP